MAERKRVDWYVDVEGNFIIKRYWNLNPVRPSSYVSLVFVISKEEIIEVESGRIKYKPVIGIYNFRTGQEIIEFPNEWDEILYVVNDYDNKLAEAIKEYVKIQKKME